jgi:hypothetical protein
MSFGVAGLTRVAIGVGALILVGLFSVSCGYSPPPAGTMTTSKVTFRAFVSQDVSVPASSAFPAGVSPGLFIVDAHLDLQSTTFISTQNNPGLLILAPNKSVTLAVGTTDNSVGVVSNQSESTNNKITLPGFTESIAISPDGSIGYAAVATASVVGQPPGAVEIMNLSSGTLGTVPIAVPSAHYIVGSHNGNRLLAFSDNSDSVTVITTGNIGTVNPITTTVAGFDRPVSGFFSADDNTAYILNCGPECGGHVASVQVMDLTTNTLVGLPLPVDAATTGLLNGSTLYVAGTPPAAPANACTGASTAAATCGRLDVVDLGTMTVTASYVITDGFHNRIDLSGNGQLFVGAKNCTNINANGEIRGCLSIFNTVSPAVVIPPENGDVTGLQAISNRNACYVAQGGELWIYDTTTDKLSPTQIDINGQVIDVKLVDF